MFHLEFGNTDWVQETTDGIARPREDSRFDTMHERDRRMGRRTPATASRALTHSVAR